jgi:hypothetical protein
VPVKRAGNEAEVRAKGRGKRRLRPPWGKLLGGKPIPRFAWNFNNKIDLSEAAQLVQHANMRRLLEYYGIKGSIPSYPIAGVGKADWLPWYELALAIASDLDDSLRIIDPGPPGKTSPRWRGLEGLILLELVDAHRAVYPRRSVRWCIIQLRNRVREYRQMSLNQLVVRYYEAKRHHNATKRAHNRKATS